MSYTVDSPIIGKPSGTLAEALAWLDIKAGAETEYATELWRLCTLVGIDPALLFAQAAHETADFSSAWWQYRRNPAGIGITGDPEQNAASHIWKNGTEASVAHVTHMALYVYGDWDEIHGLSFRAPSAGEPWVSITKALGSSEDYFRFDAIWKAGYLRSVNALADLTGKWATDPKYAEKIAAKANAIFPNKQETQPLSNELRIILNPGHRNTTGGNDEEQAMTPALAESYFNAFTAAGYETVNLGDTNGGLDETCRRMAAMIESAPGKCVLLDLHYEGSSAPGVFCIVPDVTGLTTSAPVPQDPADTWENNRGDVLLASTISNRIATATGLKLRIGIRFPGIMDESETGVGADGWRLATFAYTSPYRAKAVRLVVEHGNHTIQPDRAIIMQPDFTDKCAAAAVSAVNAVYGGTVVEPAKPPAPKPAPINWKPGDVGIVQYHGEPVYTLLAEVTCSRATLPRVAASVKKGKNSYGPNIEPGEKCKVVGTLNSPWYFWDKGDGTFPRISRSAFYPALPRPRDAS